MKNTINDRPRFSNPVGKSGSRTLLGRSLVADNAERDARRAADRVAFLAAGGLQDPTTTITADISMQLEIHELFDSVSWAGFAAASF